MSFLGSLFGGQPSPGDIRDMQRTDQMRALLGTNPVQGMSIARMQPGQVEALQERRDQRPLRDAMAQEQLAGARQSRRLQQEQFDEGRRQFDQTMNLRDAEMRAKAAGKAPNAQETANATSAARAKIQRQLRALERFEKPADGQPTPEGNLSQGFDSAFGFKLPGFLVRSGTERKNAEALLNEVTAGLTLEEASKLKGVLSDKDMQLLEQAATRLNSRTISDDEARLALADVQQTFQEALARIDGGATVTPQTMSDEEILRALQERGVPVGRR
ncbi:MAG: hypothetical protein AAFR11_05635 [Pseudomonadota bacterium]